MKTDKLLDMIQSKDIDKEFKQWLIEKFNQKSNELDNWRNGKKIKTNDYFDHSNIPWLSDFYYEHSENIG